jgi:uncharacterized membrane protein
MPVAVTRLFGTWQRILASYWFVPALMTAGAIALSFIVIRIDVAVGEDWIKNTPWLIRTSPKARGSCWRPSRAR